MSPLARLGLSVAAGLAVASVLPLVGRNLRRTPLTTWGMVVSHLGVALAIAGAASDAAFTQERQRVRFAGRTDAGVHAAGQVVTLDTQSEHSPARFRQALNHFLPEDVAIRAACDVASDFEPRRHAQSRRYAEFARLRR